MMIALTSFFVHDSSGIFVLVGGCHQPTTTLSEARQEMVSYYSEEPDSRIEHLGPAPAGESSRTAVMSGRIGGTPPLPEALLWAAVGDLDVIERLGRHAHQVRFPTWLCSYCGQAWPCEPARGDLLLDLGWIKVAVYCTVLMERATRDLCSFTPRELWNRFLEWTEPSDEARNILLVQTA